MGPSPPFSVSSDAHHQGHEAPSDITVCRLNIRPWTAGSWDSSGSHFGLSALGQQTVVVTRKNSAVFTQIQLHPERGKGEIINSLQKTLYGPSTMKKK